MNRLSVRLIASHVLVAIVSAVAVVVVVRLAAPALFDETLRQGGGFGHAMGADGMGADGSGSFGQGQGQGQGLGRGLGQGQGQARALREAFASAVDRSNLIGGVVGILTGGAVGAFAAYRLLGPLRRIGAATRRIAAGDYDERVEPPGERELGALAHDVNRLGGELARTESTRVRLLGEVAHEMRTPLTVIDGYTGGMSEGVLPLSQENLAVIAGETRRLRRLADDLSALSRSAEHRFDLDPQAHDLREVVAEATGRLAPLADEAGVALEFPAGAPVAAVVDDARIAQVVGNLVRNAIRATPAGGNVTVRVDPAEGRGPLVTVTDSGVGLAPDDVARVFERFYRVAGAPQGRDAGSGIGLTIARDIMRAHGGDLTASSPGLGRGATFVATLPPG